MKLFVILALSVNVLGFGTMILTLPADPAAAQSPPQLNPGESQTLLLSGVMLASDQAVMVVEGDPPRLYNVRVHPWPGEGTYRLVVKEAQDAPIEAEQLVPLLRGRSVVYAKCRGIRCGGDRVK